MGVGGGRVLDAVDKELEDPFTYDPGSLLGKEMDF